MASIQAVELTRNEKAALDFSGAAIADSGLLRRHHNNGAPRNDGRGAAAMTGDD
jgi:hypothetical protein